MISTENFKKVEVKSAADFLNWLASNHQQEESIWLVTYKKSKPAYYVSRDEVLDVLLCYGWIDGIRRKLDEDRTMQLVGPRRIEHWAASYKDRAEKLIEEGKMAEAGFRSIVISKENGLWDFMNDVDQLIIPDDLAKALKAKAGAWEFFTSVNKSSKRNMLRHIKIAKTEKTRSARVSKITSLAAQGEKLKGS